MTRRRAVKIARGVLAAVASLPAVTVLGIAGMLVVSPPGVDGRPTGQLLIFDPATGTTEEVVDGLHFPTGVAIPRHGRPLWIALLHRAQPRRRRRQASRRPLVPRCAPRPTHPCHDRAPIRDTWRHLYSRYAARPRKEAYVRMAELCERSGVPIPTIRFYQREGLLPAGRLTSPNQAVYDESHLRRLGLIRAMVEVGEMPIAAVAALFRRLEEKNANEYVTLGLVQYALVHNAPTDTPHGNASDAVDRLLEELGWQVRPSNPARQLLATAIETLERLDQQDMKVLLRPYATAAHKLAQDEVRVTLARDGLDERAEAVVTIGVLGDAILSALRKLAQEDVTTRALNPPSA